MKQLAIKSNHTTTEEENNMLIDYWAFNTFNDIETFVFSDSEFLNKYSNQDYFSNLRNIDTFAVYKVEKCNVCLKSFNVIINDRTHLKSYSKSNNKYCRACGHFKSSIENSIITNSKI